MKNVGFGAIALCLALAFGSVTPATAAPAVPPQVTVREGSPSMVNGTVPQQYASSLVVLETMHRGFRQELGSTVADSNGRVSVLVAIGGAGEYSAQWRVMRNGRTQWSSPRFNLDVLPRQGNASADERAQRILDHAQQASPTTRAPRKTRSVVELTSREGSGESAEDAKPVADDAADASAEGATKEAGETMNDFFKTVADSAADEIGKDAASFVLNKLFHKSSSSAATAQQVQQLSSQVQAGFAAVQAQLNAIQTALTAVGQQVATVQNEVVQTNASATASTCATVLVQANGYVSEIQDYFGNFQTTMDPQWINANVVGQSLRAGMTTVGSTIFGSGSGQPPFADGVTRLQTTVNSLGSILNTNGPVTSTSLIGACASAIAASIDAQYSQGQTSQGLQQAQSVIPAGAVDQQYFDSIQAITTYYTGWLALGQTLAARGGLLGLALLQGTSANPAQLSGQCVGQTAQPGSVLTCGGILNNLQQSTKAFDNAWASTGASWFDVTNGLLVADTRAGNASGFFTPAKNIWVQDIAQYGRSLPLAGKPVTQTNVSGLALSYLPSTGATALGPSVTGSSVAMGAGGAPQLNLNVSSTIGTIDVYSGNLGSSPLVEQLPATPFATFSASPPPLPSYTSTCYGCPPQATPKYINTVVTLPLGSPATPQAYTIVFPYQGPSGNSAPQFTTVVVQWTYTGLSQQIVQSSVTSYVPAGPLNSTSQASNAPAAGIGSLAATNWLGMNFQPANTAAWQTLIPTGSLPSTGGSPATLGSLMYKAGLMNGGQVPSNLLLYTGEQGTFSATTDTNWFSQSPNYNAAASQTAKVSGAQNFPAPNPSSYEVLSFLDANANISPGTNPVVSAPSTATGSVMSLGDVMLGGQVSSLPVNWCSPPSGKNTCNTTTNFNLSLAQGPTPNGTFYSPYSVNFAYDIAFAAGSTGSTVTMSNFTDSATSLNSTFVGQGSQAQYLWPIAPLGTGGQPTGSNCAMTAFTQGINGNAGVTNVCAHLFEDWMAGAIGVDTGPVSITGGGFQGTLTSSGNNAVQASLTNSSSSPQVVTLYAQGSGGAQVGTMLAAAPGGSSIVSGVTCTNIGSVLECLLTVSPGTSLISIPLISSNGKVTFAVGNDSSASSSVTQVAAIAASASEIPGPVEGLTAGPGNDSDTSVMLQWTAPDVTPPVTGYNFTFMSPTGIASSASTSGASPATIVTGVSPGTVMAEIPLPSSQSGVWKIGVSAVNAAGNGPLTTVSTTLGSSAPATPTGFQAILDVDGTIALSWNAVTASPQLSHYAIAMTTPGTATQQPQTQTLVSSVPAYTVQNLTQTGRYTFALTAVNSLGASAPVTTTLNVTGRVPTQPEAIDLTIDAEGWMSLAWMSSSSIPTADTYQVGLYQPGATASSTPVASVQVAAPLKTSIIRVRDLYQLGKNSPAGAWLVVVTPSNSVGVGEYGTAQMVITSGTISRLTKLQAVEGAIAETPTVVLARLKAACTAGVWNIGLSTFGSCVNGTFVPLARSRV